MSDLVARYHLIEAPRHAPLFAARVSNLPENGVGDLLANTVVLSYTETGVGGPAHTITASVASVINPGATYLPLVLRKG